jgi:hypothetical protein
MQRTLLFGGILIALFAPLPTPASAQHAPPVNPDAATIAEFMKRVGAYAALHKKLEATLPALAKQTTPQDMDAHERSLAKLMQNRAVRREARRHLHARDAGIRAEGAGPGVHRPCGHADQERDHRQ